MEPEALDWTRLPARIDGVIRSRVDRLESGDRATLTTASVSGEDFIAEARRHFARRTQPRGGAAPEQRPESPPSTGRSQGRCNALAASASRTMDSATS